MVADGQRVVVGAGLLVLHLPDAAAFDQIAARGAAEDVVRRGHRVRARDGFTRNVEIEGQGRDEAFPLGALEVSAGNFDAVRGQGPEYLIEIVFQLTAREEADGGVKKRRHGELDLVGLGQGAVIGLAGPGRCAVKCEVVEDGGGHAGFLLDVCLMGHCLVPLFDLTRFG